MNTKRIVITGGPGTGKSSIINELKQRNYTCFDEVSRQKAELEEHQQAVKRLKEELDHQTKVSKRPLSSGEEQPAKQLRNSENSEDDRVSNRCNQLESEAFPF